MNPNLAFNLYVNICIVYVILLFGYLIECFPVGVVVVIVGKNNRIIIQILSKINQTLQQYFVVIIKKNNY